MEARRMRKVRLAVLVAIVTGVLGWFLVPSVDQVQADPSKTKPCGTNECLVNERCCFLDPCSDFGSCLPSFAKCPPPLPCGPPVATSPDATPDQTPNAVCEDPTASLR